MTDELPDLRSFFDELCDVAAAETLKVFRTSMDVVNKHEDDFDPVTEGDRNAERAIRALIMQRFPDHGIIGEEFGPHQPGAKYSWIIDPIDGTRAFVSGLPVWGTLIGLYRDGKPWCGVMDQPFTRERYAALPDEGGVVTTTLTHAGGASMKIQTRPTDQLCNATLMTTSPNLFVGAERDQFGSLEKSVKMSRYGCDCYAYCMVAAGQIDLVVESGLNVYDIAALIPVVEAAGGIVTGWQGQDAANGGQILAAANSTIHQAAMEALAL